MKPYIILAFLAGIPALNAQTAVTSPASNNNNNNDDEVVQLSEFQVVAANEETYFASETLTGSRIRSEIKDLPFTISVITSEFIEDFDMSDTSDALAFTASVTDNDTSPSSVNLRGFGGSARLNGMSFFGLLTRSNIDRIEVIKGPYAAIYGTVSPGGMINYVTKQPNDKPRQSLTFNLGWNDYLRAMLSSSGPITKNKKLLYRIDVGYNETNGTQNFARSSRQEYFGALTYRFSRTTSASVEWSKMINYASRPGQVVWLRDRVSNQYVGKYTENFYFNRSGPSSSDGVHQAWNYQSVYAYIDHRINNVFSSRIATVWWDRNSPALAMGGRQDLYTDTTVLAGLRPSISDIIRDNLQLQADLLAQYSFWRMNHRTLVSLTWSKESDHSWTRALPDSVWNDPAKMQQTLDVNRQSWFYPKWNFGDYSNLTRDREQITTISSIFISHRADLFNKRLHAFVGGRFDWVHINLDDYLTGLAEQQTTDAFAPQAGINVAVTKNITAYASYSRSFTPQSQTRTRSKELYPNEEGIGIDFGFKTSFLDRRLNLTIGGFFITKDNVLQNYTNDEGIPTTDVAGQIKSDGAEIELNYLATKSLQFIGGAAWMNNRVTRNDEQPWTVGHLVARGPSPYNYGLAVIYRFKSGILNGLTLRADLKGQGKSLGEYGTGPYTRGGVTYENDNRINIKQPGFIIFNAGVSYTFKPERRNPLRHTFSLNLRNITDKEYSTGNWIPKDGFTMSFGYKLSL